MSQGARLKAPACQVRSKRLLRAAFTVACAAGVPSVLPAQATNPVPHPHASRSMVPFVGCKSDGQAGPLDAPKGKSRAFPISSDVAEKLAYYEAEDGPGVLAPRGWNCFGTYGSSGSNLYVSPEPIDAASIFTDRWPGFSGPAIQLSYEDGGTSGRFGVASAIARVFPAYRAFTRKVIAEGIRPTSDFPYGSLPHDKMTYKGNRIAEYETPPNKDGLGTESYLKKNDRPIEGVLVLSGPKSELDLTSLSMRLPANAADLAVAIREQVEREAGQP